MHEVTLQTSLNGSPGNFKLGKVLCIFIPKDSGWKFLVHRMVDIENEQKTPKKIVDISSISRPEPPNECRCFTSERKKSL